MNTLFAIISLLAAIFAWYVKVNDDSKKRKEELNKEAQDAINSNSKLTALFDKLKRLR